MIQVAIQAVPERMQYVFNLKKQLTEFGLDTSIFCDQHKVGMMWNMKRILETEWEDKVLILQDDVILAPNFQHHLADIESRMDSEGIECVSLFAPPRQYYQDAYKNGTTLYLEKNFLWNPAMLYSKQYRKDLIEFENNMKDKNWIDVWISNFAKETKRYIYISLPSIVQHDLNIKSTLGTPKKVGKVFRESYIYHEVPLGHFLNDKKL
jgi:GR25 family glycosyltransferase involved in LPS biosynthesis